MDFKGGYESNCNFLGEYMHANDARKWHIRVMCRGGGARTNDVFSGDGVYNLFSFIGDY